VNPTRWRQVNDLFHTALQHDAAAREALLAEAARTDPDLVREVRSLLASHDRAETFLEDPVWGVAPELLLDDQESSLAGRQIGSYRVLEEIGRGGMGVVYAAEDQVLGRTVALKALPPEYTRDPIRRERLRREARAAAKLSHPGVATVFELLEFQGELYIISELVQGRTLRDELRDEGPLPPGRLRQTLIEIASALAAAHAHKIVHRDLKPENVIRRPDGTVKVLDFGLARFEHTQSSPSRTSLTELGVALGTPGYMAPEQLRGTPGDARSDIFAFGVLAWELATGEHPFGVDPSAIIVRMMDIIEGRAAGLSQPLPFPGLDRIARRCMRGSPDERYQSAEALVDDLRALVSSASSATDSKSVDASGDPRDLWWWQFHQAIVAALDAATPVLAWFIRRPTGRMMFFGVLVLATASVTLRLNLLFTARVHPGMLAEHRARLFPWIAGAEAIVALLFLSTAVIVDMPDGMAAALLSIGVVTIASTIVIEPATTAAAGIRGRRRELEIRREEQKP
jgi:serine/threonine protein kinase